MIARDGHVYQGRGELDILRRSGGKVKARLIGINEASTFLGFCALHDANTFAPLEKQAFAATDEQCFLLAYRAIAMALYLKAAHVDSIPLLRQLDRGQPLPMQLQMQHFISNILEASTNSLSNLERHKELYDGDLLRSDYSHLRYAVFHLDRRPDVVCGGMIAPHHDFRGRPLQDLNTLGLDRWDLLSFSLIAAERGGAAVFAWRDNSDASCRPLLDTLLEVETPLQPHALLRFALESCENTFLSPPWWESLTPAMRDSLEERMSRGASPMFPTKPTGLQDDRLRAVSWQIVTVEARLE
jgi:hypothetical protein